MEQKAFGDAFCAASFLVPRLGGGWVRFAIDLQSTESVSKKKDGSGFIPVICDLRETSPHEMTGNTCHMVYCMRDANLREWLKNRLSW
jgi:hypothetical protein